MINQEHYQQIADVASKNGVSFDHLAERYEKGVPIELVLNCNGRNLIEPDDEWVTLDQAAEILGTKTYTFSCAAGKSGYNYFGIGTKTRSKTPGAGCRGAGRLVSRADVIELHRIRKAMHVSIAMALRVFHARFQGLI